MRCWQRFSTLFLLAVCQSTSLFVVVHSFVGPHQSGGTTRSPIVRRLAAGDATKDQVSANTINGEASASAGGLILQADAKSQLFASFAALSLSDQYDAVLTGLCAKILDSAQATPQQTITALQDPLSLMEEMNAKRIPASARSLMALVDVRDFFSLYMCAVLAVLSTAE